jgi:PEP-CTERM motif
MKFSNSSKVLMAMAIGVLIALAPTASAAPNMALCISDNPTSCSGDFVLVTSDGTTDTVTDGGTFHINSITFGNSPFNISFNGSIGTVFSLTVDTGTLQYTANPLMDLAYQDHASGAGTLSIFWGGAGFTVPGSFDAAIGGTNNASSTTATACIDNRSDGFFDLCGAALTSAIGSQTFTTPSFNATFGSANKPTVSPYSLVEEVFITSTGTGASSGDFAIDSTPEPTSMLLLGTVLTLAGWGFKRRKVTA